MTTRTRVTALVGIAATVVAAGLVLGAPPHTLKLIGALVFACTSTGCAVMCWVDTGEAAAQAGLVLVSSLTLFALATAIMIWLTAWHPVAAFAVLAGASAISCTLRLIRSSPR